jgi:hypothetical protein
MVSTPENSAVFHRLALVKEKPPSLGTEPPVDAGLALR